MTSCHKKLKVIIPARGGSKGVPRKNIRILNNLPLIAYPILAAKKCNNLSEVYVSTEDEEIAEIAASYGAEIIKRPMKYATDSAMDIDVMRHSVDYLGDDSEIVHLRATTPLIQPEILDDAIICFYNNPTCTGLRSAHECPESAYKFFKKNGLYWGGLFDHELEGDYYNQPRQSLPKTYHPNGYIDIIRPSWFMNNDSLHGNRMLAFITDFSHEIDTLEDFKILKALYD